MKGDKAKKTEKSSEKKISDPSRVSKKKAEMPAKPVDEIEELFASKKSVAAKVESEASKKSKKDRSADVKKPKILDPLGENDDWTDTKGERKKKRPTTAEGYPIYTAVEMRIGQGGGTPDCPFDCDCCF